MGTDDFDARLDAAILAMRQRVDVFELPRRDHGFPKSTPLSRFLELLADQVQTHDAVAWLVVLVARRSLPCFELYADDPKPAKLLRSLEKIVFQDHKLDAKNVLERSILDEPSFRGIPIRDCRACDTGSASEAIALAARFIALGDLELAGDSLVSAAGALDQSPLGPLEKIHEWFFDFAIPAAVCGQVLSDCEANAWRDYDLKDIPKDRANEMKYHRKPRS